MPLPEVPFPRWDTDQLESFRKVQLQDDLESWIASKPLSALAKAWGSRSPDGADATSTFKWFDEFSAEHWDFRRGQERNLATIPNLSSSQETTCLDVAHALGIVDPRRPLRESYDYALVLGGLVRACVTRPRYAAELVSSGTQLSRILGLGGYRSLSGDEIGLAENLEIDATNEFEAMLVGVKRAFSITKSPTYEESKNNVRGNGDWSIAKFTNPQDIAVIAAPSSEPSVRRANTTDTFAWWATQAGDLTDKHLLLITSPIYVPYQGAAAMESLGLPFNISVETVGISNSAGDLGAYTQIFTPANYLQEIRSAIRGYQSLHQRITSDSGN